MILESPFSQPIRLEVKGSLGTALLIVAPLLLIGFTVVAFTPWSWYLLLFVILGLCVVAVYFLKLHYWQSLTQSVLEINQDAEKQWAVFAGGKWHLLELLPNSFVSTWLVVLNFKGKAGRFSVILPADSLDKDSFRRLRVRVRIEFASD